jgi:dTDP-4-amino-4,6-dideoxygalactose transaminase
MEGSSATAGTLAPAVPSPVLGAQARPGTIRFQAPELPSLEAIGEYYRLAEASRWYSNGGPCAQLLEDRLAAAVGPDASAVLVANCTLGLIVALRAVAGEPTADERVVIVPSFTFVATLDAIAWAGFTPVFVDVDADGWHAEVDAIGAALERHRGQVAAILACSTFGTPMRSTARRRLAEVAHRHRVPVVVDAAAGFGALDDEGAVAGGRFAAEVFSFHATKPFAIGEGGAVITTDPEVAANVRSLTNFGFDADRRVQSIGMNAKLSELHAATGLAVLDRYDAVLGARRSRATATFTRLGADLDGIWRRQRGAEGSTFQFVPVLAPSAAIRDRALALGAQRGIELRAYFEVPAHRMAPFAAAPAVGNLRVTDDVAARCLSLPMANDLTEDSIERIVTCCLDAMA